MFKQFDFNDLFVLDLANNHQGKVEHGKKIIRAMAETVRRHGVRAGIKFQFRQLDTFIHAAHRSDSDNKHIQRFLSTRLSREQYQELLDEVRAQEWLHKLEFWYTPGDEVPASLSHAHRFGVFVATAPDRETLEERVEWVYRPIRIETEPLVERAA